MFLFRQREIHVNLGDHFRRIAIQQGRFILPLFHGLQRRLRQQRVARDELQRHDIPFFVDQRREPDDP